MNEKLVRYFEEILKAHNVNEEGARRIAEEIVRGANISRSDSVVVSFVFFLFFPISHKQAKLVFVYVLPQPRRCGYYSQPHELFYPFPKLGDHRRFFRQCGLLPTSPGTAEGLAGCLGLHSFQ